MEFLHDFACGVAMLIVAFVCYDWANSWWRHRRYGEGRLVQRFAVGHEWSEYLGYKIWTWFVRVLVWVIAFWNLVLAALWFIDLFFVVVAL